MGLPGRTDNEIKNYWNTRIKRRLRAGLPIYRPEIQAPENYFRQAQQERQFNYSLPVLSSLTTSSLNKRARNSDSHPFSIHQFTTFHNADGDLASLSSSVSPLSSYYVPIAWFKSCLKANSLSKSSLQINSLPVRDGSKSSVEFSQQEATGLASFSELELSNASTGYASSPASSGNSGTSSDYVMEPSDEVDNIAPEHSWSRTGLLEDLLEESRALFLSEQVSQNKMLEDVSGKNFCEPELGFVGYSNASDLLVEDALPVSREDTFYGIDQGKASGNNIPEDLCSSSSSRNATRAAMNSLEFMDSMDGDLFGFLDHFMSSIAVPDWDERSFNLSSAQTLDMSYKSGEKDDQRGGLSSPIASKTITTNHESTSYHFQN